MADKQDISSTATGAHRAWVGERPHDRAAPVPPRADATRTWATRAQNAAAPGNARHAAITKSLANFPSYKSWAEKVKTNWKKD